MRNKLKEKLSSQNFYHVMGKVFGSSIDHRRKGSKKTEAITTGKENLRNPFLDGLEIHDEITQRNIEFSSEKNQMKCKKHFSRSCGSYDA